VRDLSHLTLAQLVEMLPWPAPVVLTTSQQQMAPWEADLALRCEQARLGMMAPLDVSLETLFEKGAEEHD